MLLGIFSHVIKLLRDKKIAWTEGQGRTDNTKFHKRFINLPVFSDKKMKKKIYCLKVWWKPAYNWINILLIMEVVFLFSKSSSNF